MPRRRQSLLEDLMDVAAHLPWWAGVILAVAAYALLHPIAAQQTTAPVTGLQGIGEHAVRTMYTMFATVGQYVLPLTFGLGAVISAIRRHKRRRLHADAASDPMAVRAMAWQEFELLIGEAFRRQGYTVHETGGGRPDGGVDLVLRKDGQRYLVQCKHWKARKVDVRVVRELYGVMAAKRIHGGFVVTSGEFTSEARAFAYDKNLVLLDGAELGRLLRPQHGPAPTVPLSLTPADTDLHLHLPRRARLSGETVAIALAASILVGVGTLWLVNPPAAPLTDEAPRAVGHSAAEPHTALAAARPASRTVAERQRALEIAFESQYVPPDGCDNLVTDSQMVECANHHIRGKRAFMARKRAD